MLVGAQDLATYLDLSTVAVRVLVRDGIIPRVAHGKFDLTKSTRAYCAYLRELVEARGGNNKTLAQERSRLTKTRADIYELQRKRMVGEVVGVQEMVAAASAEATRVRTRVLAMGPKLASRLVGVKRASDAEEIIRAECEECLEGLADLEEAPERVASQQEHASIPRRIPKQSQTSAEADNL